MARLNRNNRIVARTPPVRVLQIALNPAHHLVLLPIRHPITKTGKAGGAVGSPTNRLKHRAIKSMKSKQLHGEMKAVPTQAQNYNFVFFDPEQHWCESCGVFPKSARDYLKHLHAEEHMNRETIETPWHVGIDHDPFPTFENAPARRVPVRGMQFLVPANAWFCKLCSVWIGDLHCASAHLKSRLHSNKYQVSSNIHLLKLL